MVGISWALEHSEARVATAGGAPISAGPARLKPLSIAAIGLALLLIVGGMLLARRRAAPIAGPRLTQLTFEGGIEEFPAWSPDGKQLLYAAQVGPVRKIFRKSLRGAAAAQVTQGSFDDLQPAWSPDGTRAVFVRGREAGQKLQPGDPFGPWSDTDVWSVELKTGKEERLVENRITSRWVGGMPVALP